LTGSAYGLGFGGADAEQVKTISKNNSMLATKVIVSQFLFVVTAAGIA
jgi:hypothetical protein